MVRIDSGEGADEGLGEFPDGVCVTEVYTNPDQLHDVELETLGPLATLSASGWMELTTVYTVLPGSTPESEPAAEARRIFFIR